MLQKPPRFLAAVKNFLKHLCNCLFVIFSISARPPSLNAKIEINQNHNYPANCEDCYTLGYDLCEQTNCKTLASSLTFDKLRLNFVAILTSSRCRLAFSCILKIQKRCRNVAIRLLFGSRIIHSSEIANQPDFFQHRGCQKFL